MKNLLKILLIILLSEQTFANNVNKIIITPEKLSVTEFYEKHTAIGQAKLSNSKDYFAKTKGTVDFISTMQGHKISKGDIIIAIDKAIAETSKSQAEAALYVAESNYNRDLSLFRKKILSEEITNQSKAALEKARNEHVKAMNSYEDMIIKAMDDGYIGVIKANIGDAAKEGDYLFSLTTKSDIYIFVELPQILHNRILTSDMVNAHGEKGKLILGKIIAISDYISDKGTITAKLIFPYNDHLLHGSFVENEIIFNKHQALGLPEKAVLKNNEGDFVYAVTPENKVKQVFVTLGVRTNNMIELLSEELKEGDLIVLEGLTKVYDGAEVDYSKNG
ncbi:MAG: efflux RND transporter periplasmic adaptor subunit [Rickettsiaceae bacterium]